MVFHLINRRVFINRKITNVPNRTVVVAPARVRMPLQSKLLHILIMFIVPQLYPMYIIHNLGYYKGEILDKTEEEKKKEQEDKDKKEKGDDGEVNDKDEKKDEKKDGKKDDKKGDKKDEKEETKDAKGKKAKKNK